ncbi:hypothetical protein M2345_001312 [Sphingobium sp. B8D3D]|nr:hypothetical protein [Sphingobium sp. B8D3D]MCW2416154.1 hypothetical protein [Sphingobium sp. B8D3A]
MAPLGIRNACINAEICLLAVRCVAVSLFKETSDGPG